MLDVLSAFYFLKGQCIRSTGVAVNLVYQRYSIILSFLVSFHSSYLCLFAKTNQKCLWMHAKSYCSSSWNCFSFFTLFSAPGPQVFLHLLCRLYGQMLIQLRACSSNVVKKNVISVLSMLLVVQRMLSHYVNPWILFIVSNVVGKFYSQPWPWRWPLTIHIKHWTSEEGREHGESVKAKQVNCGLKITCF